MENQKRKDQVSIQSSQSETKLLAALKMGSAKALDVFCSGIQSPEQCIAASKGFPLKCIPKNLQTAELCLIFVQQDAKNIEYVSKRILCYEFYLSAAKVNGLILNWIAEQFKTPELVKAAVASNGLALQSVPKSLQNDELYQLAISGTGNALEFVPPEHKTREMCEKAVTDSGVALAFVPSKWKTKKLCLLAIKKEGIAIQFVPRQCLDLNLCELAVSSSPLALKSVPDSLKSIEMCISSLSRDKRTTDAIPPSFYRNSELRQVAYAQECMIAETKKYVKKSGKFFVREQVSFKWSPGWTNSSQYISQEKFPIESSFDSFSDFSQYLHKDLSCADLSNLDFSGIDLAGCDLTGANIPAEVLVSQGLDSYDLYEELYSAELKGSISRRSETIPPQSILHLADFDNTKDYFSNKYYYISDLHLDYKLMKHFKRKATKNEIQRYIEKKIITLISESDPFNKLFILGDVSSNFEVSKMFYEELSKHWCQHRIIAVLGNHELWGEGLISESTSIIGEYSKLFKRLDITFLQNEIIADGEIITDVELTAYSVEKLRAKLIRRKEIIFGGIGFSAYNNNFNAEQGIYRDTVNCSEELQQTEHFEDLYSKVKEALGEKQIIVATHMPKLDWSHDTYCRKWIYLSGHTHRNECFEGEAYTLYADNQIGYKQLTFLLKQFHTFPYFDIFAYYKDGIYKISRFDYLDFNRGMHIQIQYNRFDGTITMLKKDGLYMFFFQFDEAPEKLFLLNGGALIRLSTTDLNFYYDHMDIYALQLKKTLSKYNTALEKISKAIKSIGGKGEIHGCIVDIDYYSHVYLNPIDGKITPYYAVSIVNKLIYSKILTLIETHCPEIAVRLPTSDKNVLALIQKECFEESIAEIPEYISDTSMYTPSRIMRTLQYTTNGNVIRTWNEKLISGETDMLKDNKLLTP